MRNKKIIEEEDFNFSEGDIDENRAVSDLTSSGIYTQRLLDDHETPKFHSKKALQNKDLNIPTQSKQFQKHHKFQMLDESQKFILNKNKKIHDLKSELESKLMEECTFKPKINKNNNPRNLKQFLESQQQHLNKIDEKKQVFKQKMEEEVKKSATFSPIINKNKDDKQQEIVHERLYKLKDKQKSGQKIMAQSHIPKITMKGSMLHRNKPIEELLYEDAQRRQEKQNEDHHGLESNEKPIKTKDFKTDKYAAQKFIRTYQLAAQKLSLKKTGQYTYEQFNILLKSLGYIKYSSEIKNGLALAEKKLINEAYKYISEHKLNYMNICIFLLALGGIYDISLISDENNEKNMLAIDEGERKKIHKAFYLLYRNKLCSEEIGKVCPIEENKYSPRINEQSNALAEKFREKMIEKINHVFQENQVQFTLPPHGAISHSDLLVIHKISQNLEKDRQRQFNQAETDPQCTFQPNSGRYPDDAKKSRIGKDKSQQLYSFAKNKKQLEIKQAQSCKNKEVFADLKKHSHAHPAQKNLTERSTNLKQIKDVDKTVARMFEGRRQRTQKNEFLARGEKINQSHKSNKSHKQARRIREFSNQKGNISQRAPFLVVDINLDEKLNHIYFYPGDEFRVKEIVYEFCQEHLIDHESTDHLIKLVSKEISQVLTNS